MADENFQKTGLWQSSLASIPGDPFEVHRARLLSALLSCREKVKPIVARISDVLPGLTVHDVSHLDALWETADLIAGAGYPLNPLEGFVLGLSFLFHDSAMCWEAYERGRDGVRASIEWKDAYAHECDASPNIADEERQAAADFAALRALHAHQAQRLPEISWKHPDTSNEIYLIDDVQLRTEIGPLAGKIAASHHWDTGALVGVLGDQFNAPFPLPSEWTVDPIKIACILRCADAAHINQARAPLFLYALIKRQGISLQHWRAQNRMMGPSLDSGDATNSSVIYTSSRSFKESDAEAWWIAHDAISTVSQEIESSNELLGRRGRVSAPEFRVKRVHGAQSIEELTRYLRVEGWMPCKAKPHVSNVEALVKELGGERLYGKGSPAHLLGVALRELIQNARDAVVARQFIDAGFKGEIVVSFSVNGEGTWLTVEDNGVGMSHRVMTGPLLDFGNSLWKSSLVQSEFPGLRSSRFQSIGRFGIGFYSVFMVADSVDVSSRAWDEGLDKSNTLVFTSGVSLRPILRNGRPSGFSSQISTRVRAKVKPGLLEADDRILLQPGYMNAPDFWCSVRDFVSALVVALDVPVRFIGRDGDATLIHGGSITNRELLSRICFLSNRVDPTLSSHIDDNHDRLRPIRSGERLFGVAAIATTPNLGAQLLGVDTVGGLPTALGSSGAESFIGYMDHKPQSAKRDGADFEAPPDVLCAWAIDQLNILDSKGATDIERCVAGAHAATFGCDPIDTARVLVLANGSRFFVDYRQLARYAQTTPVGILKVTDIDHADVYNSIESLDGVVLIRPLVNSISCNLKMEEGRPVFPNSIVGCLHRAILNGGRTPQWQTRTTDVMSIFRQPMELIFVTST